MKSQPAQKTRGSKSQRGCRVLQGRIISEVSTGFICGRSAAPNHNRTILTLCTSTIVSAACDWLSASFALTAETTSSGSSSTSNFAFALRRERRT